MLHSIGCVSSLALTLAFPQAVAPTSIGGGAPTMTVAEGPSPNALTIHTIAASGSVVGPRLVGIGFVDLELSGRTDLERLDRTRPQRIAAPGAPTRLELPNGVRVFAYRRTGGSAFGFLAVSPDGGVSILLQRPSVGGATPFLPTLGAARDGAWLAVATTPAAGGDLWLLRPLGGSATLLTPGSPLAIDDTSITLLNGAVFATIGSSALARAPIPAGPLATIALPLSNGIAPAFVDPEIAVSADGSTFALLAGEEKHKNDLYVGLANGTVWNRTKAPARHEAPGFAPGEALGPMLALSDDGSRVAYQRRIIESELFLADASSSATGLGSQLTDNAHFQESIGTGITLGFALNAAVHFGMGGIHATFDEYRGTTNAAVSNLTLTGSATAPFQDVATIVPQDVVHLPSSDARLVSDGGVTPGLRIADPSAPVSTVVGGNPTLVGPAANGGAVPLALPGAAGSWTLAVTSSSGAGTSVLPLLALGASTAPKLVAASPGAPRVAFHVSVVPAGAGGAILVFDVPSGAPSTFAIPPGVGLASMELDASGNLRLVATFAGAAVGIALTPAGQPLLATMPAPVVYVLR